MWEHLSRSKNRHTNFNHLSTYLEINIWKKERKKSIYECESECMDGWLRRIIIIYLGFCSTYCNTSILDGREQNYLISRRRKERVLCSVESKKNVYICMWSSKKKEAGNDWGLSSCAQEWILYNTTSSSPSFTPRVFFSFVYRYKTHRSAKKSYKIWYQMMMDIVRTTERIYRH